MSLRLGRNHLNPQTPMKIGCCPKFMGWCPYFMGSLRVGIHSQVSSRENVAQIRVRLCTEDTPKIVACFCFCHPLTPSNKGYPPNRHARAFASTLFQGGACLETLWTKHQVFRETAQTHTHPHPHLAAWLWDTTYSVIPLENIVIDSLSNQQKKQKTFQQMETW